MTGLSQVVGHRSRAPAEHDGQCLQTSCKQSCLAERRRLRAYLATGVYKDELVEARWVA